ncbi:hypothetical protein [Hyphomicrobium sp.]|uniref:hypothetical protein n=1 Tax=Hyphomicrobium sp. TaxID=82 RepID=UPI002FE34AFF
MNPVIYGNATVFLVVTGAAHAAHLTGATSITHGITFRHHTPSGAIDLAIAAPTNLSAYADLAAAAILKPVCIPIALTHVRHGIVHAQLNERPAAHKLAQHFLAAMTATNHPAPPCRCLHDCTPPQPRTDTKEQ